MTPLHRPIGVTDWLGRRAGLTPDRIALIDGVQGPRVTYAEWNTRVNQTANLLRSLGVTAGDRVSVYSANSPHYLDLFFAAGKVGAILHNLNWRLTVHELRGCIAEVEPVVLFYSDDWREQVDEMRSAMDSVKHVVALDGEHPGDRPFAERDTEPDSPGEPLGLTLDDPWGIYYTGGTTGRPKGAVLTHGNITWNSVNTVVSWGITAEHVAPLQLPLFHVGGPNIFMVPLVHVGGTTIICREFDLDETFDLIERGEITHYVGVPTMYQMMQAHPRWDEADFSGLELVISGGAPCPLPVMEQFWDRGVDFKMGYGLTEATGNNFWLSPEKVREKRTSVGIPAFHVEARVVADDGSECGPDQPGELQIRGPHVMAGYWRQPDATAATIRDGWLHTGDMAERDRDGFFTVVGRSKDVLICGGENVYPAEVESVMLAYPGIAEAVLVGVPDEKWGEVGRACLVLKADVEFDETGLMAFMGEKLARYKLPRSVDLLDELPKTAIGKVDKKLLAGIGGL